MVDPCEVGLRRSAAEPSARRRRTKPDWTIRPLRADDVRDRFDEVAQVLAALDVDRTWEAATDSERPSAYRRICRGSYGII